MAKSIADWILSLTAAMNHETSGKPQSDMRDIEQSFNVLNAKSMSRFTKKTNIAKQQRCSYVVESFADETGLCDITQLRDLVKHEVDTYQLEQNIKILMH